MKRIVIIPDLQVPYEDKAAVDAVTQFVEDYKPDSVACVGDEIDLPQLSTYTRGLAGEFTRRLDKDRNRTIEVLKALQIKNLSRSNHSDRLFKSIASRLPGLSDLPELSIEGFLKLKEIGVTYHHQPYELAPGWLLMHGDEAGVRPGAGSTAAGLAQRTNKSCVVGHTHRAGLIPYSMNYGKRLRETRWGFEVGNLMDFKNAGYVKVANWQQAFGILHVDKTTVTPQLVPISNRSFVVDGTQYKW